MINSAGSRSAKPFWERLREHGRSVALIEGDRTLTYAQLFDAVDEQRQHFCAAERALAFLASDRSMQNIICYLALLAAGHTVFLCDEIEPELVSIYRPRFILSQSSKLRRPLPGGYEPAGSALGHSHFACRDASDNLPAALCLLLSTSGSTGTSKLVRLSRDNVAAAAEQVCEALHITDADRAVTSIPLSHVYGLSVLHSHLAAGSAVVITKRSVLDRRFWDYVNEKKVTSLGGVPWTYKAMRNMGVVPELFPTLRKAHQSGARLDSATAQWLCETFPPRGVDLYFMYGQTEATGRMCVLPPELARSKAGSVGFAVPHGSVKLSEGNEVVYSGPNVMLGYATRREDLYRGDDVGGVLRTGDIGILDPDNCLYLTGRLNRFCKILGNRINLDDVESFFSNAAALSDDTFLTLVFEEPPHSALSERVDALAAHLRIPRQSITLCHIEAFPRSSTGKIAYDNLHAMVKQSSFQNNGKWGAIL